MSNNADWVSFTSAVVKEEGFQFVTDYKALLLKRGLLGKGVLHLANGLADLETDYTSPECVIYDRCLFCLVEARGGALYRYLLETYGPEAINENLWLYLSQDLRWPLRTEVFAHMPTEVLEKLAKDIWLRYQESCADTEYKRESECKREVLKHRGARTDIYGFGSLPPELAFGLLCDEDPTKG